MVILAIIPMMLGTAKKGTKGPQHRARDKAREGKGVICTSDDEAQPAKEQSDSAVQPGRRRKIVFIRPQQSDVGSSAGARNEPKSMANSVLVS